MYSINENIQNEIVIKKSKFITKLYKVENINEVNNLLNDIKIKYKDSTHICYAYIVNNEEKMSDDKEPSGTAGLPMLNVIKKNNLNNILAIVIRYFGGTKLGAGGLSRAYSNSIIEALKLTKIVELEEAYLIEIEFNYDQVKLIDYILTNKKIINKIYNDNIIYLFYLNKEELNFIPELEKAVIHISIKDKTLISKD